MLLHFVACIGLDSTVREKDAAGHDLDTGPEFGDSSGSPLDTAHDDNREPVADAGEDADGRVGVVVQLDGSDSADPDEDPLDYTWRIVSQPSSSSAALVDEDRVDPQFIPDVAGRYVIGLVVSDGALESDEDTVEITVTEENGAPVANAGSDASVTVGDVVALDGSGSSDPEDDPLQFAWTMTTRPAGSSASLSSTTSAVPRFTADVAGTYEITLTVTDGTDVSAPDEVRVVASEDSGDTGGDTGCGCASGTAGGWAPMLGLVLPLLRRRPR